MHPWLWAFAVLYAVGVALLLLVTKRHRKWYTLAKGLLSGLFLLGAGLGWATGRQRFPGAFSLLLTALAFCAVGDVLLGVANRRAKTVSRKPFLAGAAVFSLAHGVFCALFFALSPFRWHNLLVPLALVAVLLLLDKWGWVRLRRMKPVAMVYTFLVGLMATKALSAAIQSGFAAPFAVLLAAGAFLFLVSDIVLLFLYFGTRRRKAYRYINLTTYYAGMLLLAFSAHWM